MDGEFSVYILQNEAGRRYIGCTSNLSKRFDAHNKGLSLFTRNKCIWNLEWESKTMSHTEALRLEKLLKKQKGGDGVRKLMQDFQRGS